MRVPEGKRHAVYLLHLVRLRVAVLLVGEHGIGLVRVEIQRYAVLFVLRVHLIYLLGLARRALRRGGYVIAVRKREVADRLGQRERRAGILHVLLRLLHAQALVRPRMARDAAECTGGERAGHGDGGDGRKRDQTAAPTAARPAAPVLQREVHTGLELVRRMQLICAPVQHILHFLVKNGLIHVIQPPSALSLLRSAPAADDGGRKTGGS